MNSQTDHTDPKIVLGLPTYKRPIGLKRALASIAELNADAPFEIVVAENDLDAQEGAEFVKELAPNYPIPLSVVLSSSRGISQARNALVQAAFIDRKADILIMLDDDQWVDPDWFNELIAMHHDLGADVISGHTLPDFEGEAVTWELELPIYWRPKRHHGSVDMAYSTCGVLVSRQVLDKLSLPLFDEQFSLTGGGDKEFFTRLKDSGGTFAFSQKAIAYETFAADRRTLKWARKRAFRIGSTDMGVILKHYSGTRKIWTEYARIPLGLVAGSSKFMINLFNPLKRELARAQFLRASGKISTLLGHRAEVYKKTSGQ